MLVLERKGRAFSCQGLYGTGSTCYRVKPFLKKMGGARRPLPRIWQDEGEARMQLKIGELAKLSGCQVVTIRYYEKAGLLSAPASGI